MVMEPLTPAQIAAASRWLATWRHVEELRGFVVRRRHPDGIAVATAHFVDPVPCPTCGGSDPEGGSVVTDGPDEFGNTDTDDCPDHRPRRKLGTTTNFYRPDGRITDTTRQPL